MLAGDQNMMRLSYSGLAISGTFAFGLLFSTSLSHAADVDQYGCTQAVSAVNGKVELAAGYLEDDDEEGGRFQGVASLSMPLGCMFGAQIDVGAGDLDGDGYAGVQGHLFMRDPDSYLIGVTAHYVSLDGEDLFRIGPEAELYLDNITISAVAAFEDFDGNFDDSFVGGIEAKFYATENFAIAAGYRHFLDTDAAALNIEYQPETFPASFFMDGMVGSDDYASIMGGIRFYFGGDDKSLIRRHREDDPFSLFTWLRKDQNGGGMMECPEGEEYVEGEDCVPIPQ